MFYGGFMKIGLISDTHNNLKSTKEALILFERLDVDKIYHLGDLVSPDVAEMFPEESYFLVGNCDSRELKDFLDENDYNFSNSYDHEYDGKRFFFIHGDNRLFLNRMINDGLFDCVIHGHTHTRKNRKRNSTLVVNPGALRDGTISVNKTVCVLDTESLDVDFHKID